MFFEIKFKKDLTSNSFGGIIVIILKLIRS